MRHLLHINHTALGLNACGKTEKASKPIMDVISTTAARAASYNINKHD